MYIYHAIEHNKNNSNLLVTQLQTDSISGALSNWYCIACRHFCPVNYFLGWGNAVFKQRKQDSYRYMPQQQCQILIPVQFRTCTLDWICSYSEGSSSQNKLSASEVKPELMRRGVRFQATGKLDPYGGRRAIKQLQENSIMGTVGQCL